jgi:uncharacterized membrane protein YfcA
MSSLSFVGLAFYVLVLIGAFAVRSAAGFGAGLIAVPMLAFILPVSTAVSVATALTTVTSLQQVSRDWRHIAWRQFAVIVFYTIFGIGLGFYCINLLDEHSLRRSLGVFLIIYSIYALWMADTVLVLPARWHRALAAGTGIGAGFFSALFGGGVGPIYVVYFNILRMKRDVFRATMSTVVLVGGAARMAGYASYGFYSGSTITLLAVGLPLVIVGSWLGDRLARRLSTRTFGWLVGGLVLLSGVALLLK